MLTLNVIKPNQIKAAVDLVTKKTGGTLDYLINNVGHNHFISILDKDLNVVKKLFKVNFYGLFAVTQAFAPLFVKAKGIAVYITFISSYINIPFIGKYLYIKYVLLT